MKNNPYTKLITTFYNLTNSLDLTFKSCKFWEDIATMRFSHNLIGTDVSVSIDFYLSTISVTTGPTNKTQMDIAQLHGGLYTMSSTIQKELEQNITLIAAFAILCQSEQP